MQIAEQRFRATGNEKHLREAVQAARRIIELYPQSPDAHADLGQALLQLGKQTNHDQRLSQARAALQRALDLDDARPRWEILRRIPPTKRDKIESQIAETRS